ncbi:MAG TPA: FtsQ-type POTRA domain-containing protein [Limnochordia bacterium]|nr:FtsQ-type POTRA domain-containing protein [Limnochordia bacterium]
MSEPRPSEHTPLSRGFAVALVCFSVLLAVYIFSQSRFFTLAHIEITGAGSFTRAQILELAGVQTGVNVFHIDTGAAATRLRRQPRIADAVVSRRYPDGLVIALTERQSVGVVEIGQAPYDVDAAGRLLGPARPDAALPVLQGEAPPADAVLAPGDILQSAGLRAAAQVAGALSGRLALPPQKIDATDAGAVVVILHDGTRVLVGDTSSLRRKTDVLVALLQQVAELHLSISQIDIRAPREPVVKKR